MHIEIRAIAKCYNSSRAAIIYAQCSYLVIKLFRFEQVEGVSLNLIQAHLVTQGTDQEQIPRHITARDTLKLLSRVPLFKEYSL